MAAMLAAGRGARPVPQECTGEAEQASAVPVAIARLYQHPDSDGPYFSIGVLEPNKLKDGDMLYTAHRARVELPPLGESLRRILGRPNFACYWVAERLRVMGQDIPRKSEEEQAAVIYWMLGLFLEHGENWEGRAAEVLGEAGQAQEGADD